MRNYAYVFLAIFALMALDPICGEKILRRIRRGNFGQRYSGGLGSSHGVLGSHYNSGSPVVYDRIALWAISGPSRAVLDGHQAQINAQASSAHALDRLQQQGQHSAAYAAAAANDASAWYNAIATGPVPSGYKGERG